MHVLRTFLHEEKRAGHWMIGSRIARFSEAAGVEVFMKSKVRFVNVLKFA